MKLSDATLKMEYLLLLHHNIVRLYGELYASALLHKVKGYCKRLKNIVRSQRYLNKIYTYEKIYFYF